MANTMEVVLVARVQTDCRTRIIFAILVGVELDGGEEIETSTEVDADILALRCPSVAGSIIVRVWAIVHVGTEGAGGVAAVVVAHPAFVPTERWGAGAEGEEEGGREVHGEVCFCFGLGFGDVDVGDEDADDSV